MVSCIYPNRSSERRLEVAALGVVTFMIVFFLEAKVYDLATAMFFALGLGLMARGKWSEFFAVFAFASANRETAFLLTMVYAGFMFHVSGVRLFWLSVGWQMVIFAVVRICLMAIFAGNVGVSFLFTPWLNLQDFWNRPVSSLVHWSLFAFVIWLCVRRWKEQPRLLRIAFVVMAPALMVMYLVLGRAFEVRVFAELFPVVWMIVIQGKIEL